MADVPHSLQYLATHERSMRNIQANAYTLWYRNTIDALKKIATKIG
ncbi:hypothetical protein Turpa_1103 [Turneriella parva DSM 21527]|uniref:Uncharacterized protein n=1 Tax=Turneriella parva (strain ATCC BAA-1111 / DSM 21527 / NCTC 11395 / H) TaxID=869212 RepID=I4B394_TURPD|nr:hypothetical protein Turpa_1103 [Turneriella parva DSM 21527]